MDLRKIKRLDKVIVFDIEANTQENEEYIRQDFQKEIIEIGAVKIHDGVIVDTFEMFIKPIVNPTLTDFIKDLTGIQQEDVDDAKNFREAYDEIREWFLDHHLISIGTFDQEQMLYEIKINCIHDYTFSNQFVENYIDLKRMFKKATFSPRTYGLDDMMDILNIEPEGVAHRALTDSINAAKIYLAITK